MKTIIEMAREAGFEFNRLGCTYTSGYLEDYLDRFAALVRADENKACQDVCENEWVTLAEKEAGLMYAAAIRARGNT